MSNNDSTTEAPPARVLSAYQFQIHFQMGGIWCGKVYEDGRTEEIAHGLPSTAAAQKRCQKVNGKVLYWQALNGHITGFLDKPVAQVVPDAR